MIYHWWLKKNVLTYLMYPTRNDLTLVKWRRDLEYNKEDRRIEWNYEEFISF